MDETLYKVEINEEKSIIGKPMSITVFSTENDNHFKLICYHNSVLDAYTDYVSQHRILKIKGKCIETESDGSFTIDLDDMVFTVRTGEYTESFFAQFTEKNIMDTIESFVKVQMRKRTKTIEG